MYSRTRMVCEFYASVRVTKSHDSVTTRRDQIRSEAIYRRTLRFPLYREMTDIAMLIACRTLRRDAPWTSRRLWRDSAWQFDCERRSDPANLQRYLELCSAPMKWNQARSWDGYRVLAFEEQTAYSNTPIGCDVQTWGARKSLKLLPICGGTKKFVYPTLYSLSLLPSVNMSDCCIVHSGAYPLANIARIQLSYGSI